MLCSTVYDQEGSQHLSCTFQAEKHGIDEGANQKKGECEHRRREQTQQIPTTYHCSEYTR